MSIKQMSRVWEKAATDDPSTLLVMLALADWANDDGVCWPAIASIAEKCRISPRTAQRIIHELEECGLLEVTRKRGRAHTNTYKLKVPTCHVLFDLKGVTESPFEDEKVPNEAEKVTIQVLKGVTAMAPEPSEPPTTEPLKANATKFKLPDWMEPYSESWEGFLEMRKKIRAPVTDHGKKLLINSLHKFAARGHLPDEILDRSTEHSWRGLFEPNGQENGKRQVSKDAERSARNREAIIRGITGHGASGHAAPHGGAVPERDNSRSDRVLDGSTNRARAAVAGSDS